MDSLRDVSFGFFSKVPELVTIESPVSVLCFTNSSKQRNKDSEFRLLRKITETPNHMNYLVTDSPEIQPLNRYSDILPYADTIVKLADSSYINANWVRTPHNPPFIATQGPLEATRLSFWQMVWQSHSDLIIMISALREAGKTKCDQYFPASGHLSVGHFTVLNTTIENKFPSLVLRTFELRDSESGECRELQHIQCLAWPDHGAPELSEEYESLLYLLTLMGERSSPVVVHCSAGVGRTGTLIALYWLHSDILENAENAEISVFRSVRQLREQRWGMVQTKLQYEFLYKFMIHYLQHQFKL